jgi:hypothetical protein
MNDAEGQRYCPNCNKIMETRALSEGFSQTQYRGIRAKRRRVICWAGLSGSNGCATKWYTLEMSENDLKNLSLP